MADMGFSDAVRSVLTKYATFSGRARRAEYWWFVLFCILASLALEIIDAMILGGLTGGMDSPSQLGTLFSLATLLPSIAVGVRRLHDVGRSGWWWLLALIPVVGWIILVYWAVRRGDTGPNAFGPDPITEDGPLSPSAIPYVPRR